MGKVGKKVHRSRLRVSLADDWYHGPVRTAIELRFHTGYPWIRWLTSVSG